MTQNPRTCVGCRQLDAATNLVRVVATHTTCQVDEKGGSAGRGAWIHPDLGCLNRAIQIHAFDRAFRRGGLDSDPVRQWLEDKSSGAQTPELTRVKKAGRNPMGTQ